MKHNETSSNGEYMRAKAVANFLGVSLGCVRNWIKDGRIPSVKIGKARLVSREKLLALMERLHNEQSSE